MTASLQASAQTPHSAAAQDQVNRTMAKALRETDSIKGLRATTGDYSVNPTDSKQTAWRAQQTLILRFDAAPGSSAAKPVRDLIGQLQADGMMLQSLRGILSQQSERETRARAIADAASQLQAEAKATATALGEQVGPLRTVQLDVATPIRPVMHTMMLAARAAPPVARSSSIEERVSLSATIMLRPTSR